MRHRVASNRSVVGSWYYTVGTLGRTPPVSHHRSSIVQCSAATDVPRCPLRTQHQSRRVWMDAAESRARSSSS